jgi:hypothetical protein
MKYILLIYGDEKQAYQPGTPQFGEMVGAYNAFGEAARAAGVFVTGEALLDTPTATTVRVRNGERLVTDGPFAETKEQLGGYYVLDCKDLDEAIAWAARIPTAGHAHQNGSVEVRPLMVFD